MTTHERREPADVNEKEWPDAESTGVVLAGGYSRRFGEADKALATVGGEPVLKRVVVRLGDLAETVVVNCRTDQREAFETTLKPTSVSVDFAEDPVTDRGPLFGFRVALERIDDDICVLTTCDTPFLDSQILSDLVQQVETGAEAAAARSSEMGVQPIQAAYRTEPAKSACDELLDSGERRLSALFDRLASRPIPADELSGNVARSLFDVDTPEDREQAVRMLGEEITGQGTTTQERMMKLEREVSGSA